jgi:hypothetical protein
MKNKFSWKLASSLLLIVLSVVLFSSSTFAAGWNISTIPNGGSSYKSSFLLDTSTNTPYICYYNGSEMQLRLLSKSGGVWVDTYLGLPGEDVAMVMAPDKTLHIAAGGYDASYLGSVRYMKYVSPTNKPQYIIATNTGANGYTSGLYRVNKNIAIGLFNNDPNDPVISYYDSNQNSLKYAYFNTTWKSGTIEAGQSLILYPTADKALGAGYAQSMSVNGTTIRIIYSTDSTHWNGSLWNMYGNLREATSTNKVSWALNTIASNPIPAARALFVTPTVFGTSVYQGGIGGECIKQTSIVLDTSGNPYRFAYRQDNGDLFYNADIGIAKASTASDGTMITSIPISSAKDSTGKIGVVYETYFKGSGLGQPDASYLTYATLSGSVWTVSTIESAAPQGTISLAYDSSNRPQIVYFNNGLKYAAWDDASPTVAIDAPVLNDKFMGGSTTTIKWRVTDDIALPTADYITISLATKDATSPTAPWTAFKAIATSLENNPGTSEGSYDWTTPFVSYEAMISIEAVDGTGNKTFLNSNKFSIILPFANIKYVAPSPTGNDSNNGNTPSTAYATIQKAMDNMISSNGKIILAPGIYKGTGNYNIKWKTIDGILLQGDSSGGSIISAEGLGRIITAEVSSLITMEIKNVTIKDGKITGTGMGDTNAIGGAIYVGQNVKKLVLNNVNFYGNKACFAGAIAAGSPSVSNLQITIEANNCSFEGNAAYYRGGVAVNGTWNISNSTLQANTSSYEGGVAYYSKWNVDKCQFRYNTAGTLGGSYPGGVAFIDSPCNWVVTNSKFIGNTGGSAGCFGASGGTGSITVSNSIFHKNTGWAAVAAYVSVAATNCTFTENNNGAAVSNIFYGFSGNNVVLTNCILWDYKTIPASVGSMTVKYCDYPVGSLGGTITNSINSYPKFISTSESDPNFLKLDMGSPALHSGMFDGTIPTTDLAGAARGASPKPCMGAYESSYIGVNVLYPNGGEIFANKSIPITWESGLPIGEVGLCNIRLSTDGGLTFPILITSEVRNTQTCTYEWLNTMASINARISVEVFASNSVYGWASDASNANFEIKASEVSVEPTGVGSDSTGDGSKDKPFKTIAFALNRVGAGGIIHMQPGLYAERLIAWPNTNGIKLIADQPGTAVIDPTSIGNGTPFLINNALSITMEGIVIKNVNSSYAGGVMQANAIVNLDYRNMTFQNNKSTSSYSGVFYGPAASNINVYDCRFESNSAGAYGGVGYYGNWYIVNSYFKGNNAPSYGGVFYSVKARIINSTFESNTSYQGAVFNQSSIEAENCTFLNNGSSAANTGGGISFLGTMEAYNCYFKGNNSDKGGITYGGTWKSVNSSFISNGKNASQGGVAWGQTGAYASSWTAINSVFFDNGKDATVGGVAYTSLWPSVVNCTFANNKGTSIIDANGNWNVKNSIFAGPSAQLQISSNTYGNFNNCDIFQGPTPPINEVNCILGNPNFLSTDEANPNFLRLAQGSPALNSGDDTVLNPPLSLAYDITGVNNRKIDTHVDMGAYENKLVDRMIVLDTPMAAAISLEAGSTYNITWHCVSSDASATTDYKTILEYTFDGGVIWTPINTLVAPSTGTYSWLVPNSLSNICRVRAAATISGSSNTVSSSKESGNLFTIRDTTAPVLTVEAAFKYAGKSGFPITWEATDLIQSTTPVVLRISKDSGTTWTIISNPVNRPASAAYVTFETGSAAYPTCRISVTATDYSNNTTTKEVSFGVDTIAPTMEVSATVEALTTSVKFTVKPHDNNAVAMIRVTPGENAAPTNYVTDDATSGNITIEPSSNGSHLVTFEVYDVAGNVTVETRIMTIAMPNTPEVEAVFMDGQPIEIVVNPNENAKLSAQIRHYAKRLFDPAIPSTKKVFFMIKQGANIIQRLPADIVQDASNLTIYYASADATLPGKGTYNVLVEVTDLDGNITTWESKHAIKLMNVMTVSLKKPKNIPNPFNPKKDGETAIVYKLSSDMNTILSIYDMSQKPVWSKSFNAGENGGMAEPAENRVMWDGKNNAGVPVANGVYIFIIRSGQKIIAQGQMMVAY